MKSRKILAVVITAVSLCGLAIMAHAKQDKYTVKALNGVAFSEFRGYEDWQVVAPSQTDDGIKAILANPVMINAYREGIPGNGKPFPEGAKIVKIEWSKKTNPESPYSVTVPDTLKSVSFIEKDSKRFPDTSGWGYAQFLYDPVTDTFIVQDAVAHNEGLGANWKTRRAFWADRAANESALRTNLLSLQTTRTRHVGRDPNVERYDPDLWTDEFAFLNQPGQAEIQSDLFYDYRTNVDAYPKWQAWMREKQPRLLVIWGKYDLSFDLSEPEAYRRDVPNAQVHVLDAGHFALDTAADQIAQLVRGFMK
jgi:hypothetical protein